METETHEKRTAETIRLASLVSAASRNIQQARMRADGVLMRLRGREAAPKQDKESGWRRAA